MFKFHICFLLLEPKRKVLPASKQEALEWWDQHYLGFFNVPVMQIKQPDEEHRTRPLHAEQIYNLMNMIKDDNTVNPDIYVVIHSKKEYDLYLQQGEDYDPHEALYDPEVLKEVIAGSHSVESMKRVLEEPGGKENYGWLVMEPLCRIFICPQDDPKSEAVLLHLGARDNRQKEQQLKSSFRDNLFLMRRFRDLTKDRQTNQFSQKDTVRLFMDTTGLAKGTCEQYWQFVNNEMVYTYVDAILADAEQHYGARGGGRRARGRPKLITGPAKMSSRPPAKILGNSTLLPLLQLTLEDRLEMLSRVYHREINEVQLGHTCKSIAQKTYVYNSILLETKKWLAANKPKVTAPTDWEEFLKQFPSLNDDIWHASLCARHTTRRNSQQQARFLEDIKNDVDARLKMQYKLTKVNLFALNLS